MEHIYTLTIIENYTVIRITDSKISNFQMMNGEVINETTVDYEPSAVSILNDEEMAVGESSGGHAVRIYGISGGAPEERKKLALTGPVTDLAYR